MRRGRQPLVSRRVRAALSLLLSFGLAIAPGAATRASQAPFTHATTGGQVGCEAAVGVPCPQWDEASPPGADHWTFDDKRTATVRGDKAEAIGSGDFKEVDSGDGMLESLTLSANLSAEIIGRIQEASSEAHYFTDFYTRATSLTITGSLAVESHGTDSLGSAAQIHVTLDCGQIDVTAVSSAGYEIPNAADAKSLAQQVDVVGENGVGACDLNVDLLAGGGSTRGGTAEQHTLSIAKLSLTIAAGPGPSPTAPDVDTDGDGLLDSWETDGIPYEDSTGEVHHYLLDCDANGESDADAHRKDVFVEIDAMDGPGLAPTESDLHRVVNAFAVSNAPNPGPELGINLHLCLDEQDLPTHSFGDGWALFSADANLFFGTPTERVDPNAVDLLVAKRDAFHYAIFGDTCCGNTTSGLGEMPGNEFWVTLGGWPTSGGTAEQKAGTFMHELGHNLGLGHGGRNATSLDDVNYKPNYYSIMNYDWQSPRPWMTPGSWPLSAGRPGYSDFALADLDESKLDECAGLGTPDMTGYVVPFTRPAADGIPRVIEGVMNPDGIDWDGDGHAPASCDARVAIDLNEFTLSSRAGEVLHGSNDWAGLVYDFRGTPNFASGVHETNAEAELTYELDQKLDTVLPPYDAARVAARIAATGAGRPPVPIVLAAAAVVVVAGAALGLFLVVRRRRRTT